MAQGGMGWGIYFSARCVIFLQLFTNVVVPWFCFVLFHVFRDMVDHAKFSR